MMRGALAAALLLSAVVAEGAVVTPPQERSAIRLQPTFRVAGRIAGLIPGHRTSMPVTVRNRYGFPIVVTRVGATVSSRRVGCPARNLAVRPWVGRRRIAPGATRRVTLEVTLRRAAPVACAGARFPLNYTGRALEAGRP
jgi:hypothetical protein